MAQLGAYVLYMGLHMLARGKHQMHVPAACVGTRLAVAHLVAPYQVVWCKWAAALGLQLNGPHTVGHSHGRQGEGFVQQQCFGHLDGFEPCCRQRFVVWVSHCLLLP